MSAAFDSIISELKQIASTHTLTALPSLLEKLFFQRQITPGFRTAFVSYVFHKEDFETSLKLSQ